MVQLGFMKLLLLLGLGVVLTAGEPKKKPKKEGKSAVCEKGDYASTSKDATIPLCDAHYPDAKAKSSWLILFYNKKADDNFKDVMNPLAVDLGNEPPEKSKSLKKAPKKQRTRIKDLAEKYEFVPDIPKKGLEDKGKEPLLKVGAVCCNCAADGTDTLPTLCNTRETGIRLVRPGKKETVMPGGAAGIRNAGSVMKWAMGELGFVKEQQNEEGETEPTRYENRRNEDSGARESPEELREQLEKLKEVKTNAIANEDYKLAAKVKKEIPELEIRLKAAEEHAASAARHAADAAEEHAALQKSTQRSREEDESQLKSLEEQKKDAIASEDYKLAGTLKKEIAELDKKMKDAGPVKAAPSPPVKAAPSPPTMSLEQLKAEMKKASADEDYGLAASLQKKMAALEAAGPSKAGDKLILEKLKADMKKASADEDYELAAKLKKEIAALDNQIKDAGPSKAGDKLILEKLKADMKKASAEEDYELAGKLKKEIAEAEKVLKKAEL